MIRPTVFMIWWILWRDNERCSDLVVEQLTCLCMPCELWSVYDNTFSLYIWCCVITVLLSATMARSEAFSIVSCFESIKVHTQIFLYATKPNLIAGLNYRYFFANVLSRGFINLAEIFAWTSLKRLTRISMNITRILQSPLDDPATLCSLEIIKYNKKKKIAE